MKIYEWGRRGDPALLYWDGLGGTGLHANEIGPILAADYGLHVIAPDPPGHGRTPAPEADAFRPSRLAATAAELLAELGVERAAFVGFSWGGRVGCWFAASFPERTTCLALVEGGHHGSLQPTGLEAAIAEARAEREEETFESWEAYLAYERESLRRWTPDLVAEAYPAIVAAGVPVLLVVAAGLALESEARFRAALPEARIETIPDAIHDLVSFAPDRIAGLVGQFVSAQPPP